MATPQKILVIDVEATCWENLSPNKHSELRNEIIEIGVAVLDIKRQTLESKESIIVLPPTMEISEFCTNLTTLTQEFIDAQGIEYYDAMSILLNKYRSDRQIFASWGDYDRKSIEKNCTWNSTRYPFAGNMHLNIKSLFAAKYGYNAGQNQCAKDLGITVEGTAHRGVDDAWNSAKILAHILWSK